MTRSVDGNIMVAGCLLIMAFFLLSLLVLDIGRFYLEHRRAHSFAQGTVLGALRMRVQALGRIAARWETIGSRLGPVISPHQVQVRTVDIAALQIETRNLARALSGYQARTSSVLTLLAQANQRERHDVHVVRDQGTRLRISARSVWMVDPTGDEIFLPEAWYARQWPDTVGDREAPVCHAVEFRTHPFFDVASFWSARVQACGQMMWNPSESGNGGVAYDWAQAVERHHLKPYRTASFRATLAVPQ